MTWSSIGALDEESIRVSDKGVGDGRMGNRGVGNSNKILDRMNFG